MTAMENSSKSSHHGVGIMAASEKLLATQHVVNKTTTEYKHVVYDYYAYYTNDLNSTTNQSYNLHSDFFGSIHMSASTYAVFLCIVTIIVNLCVIVACLKSRSMRRNCFYLQIVNLAVVNIIIATFVIPLTVYHVVYKWYLGMTMCRVFVIADVFLPFTSIIIMILVNIDRHILVSHPRLHKWLFQGSIQWIMLFIPWFVSFVVVVPIWTSGSIPIQNEPGECMVPVSYEAAILCPVLTYFVPLLTLIFLNFRLLLVRLHSTTGTSTITISERMILRPNAANVTILDAEDTNDEQAQDMTAPNNVNASRLRKRDDFSAVTVANITFCVMWFPYQCTSFLLTMCFDLSCIPSVEFTHTVTWIGTSSACVVPLCWFIDSLMRSSFCSCCGGKSRSKALERMNSNETYL